MCFVLSKTAHIYVTEKKLNHKNTELRGTQNGNPNQMAKSNDETHQKNDNCQIPNLV